MKQRTSRTAKNYTTQRNLVRIAGSFNVFLYLMFMIFAGSNILTYLLLLLTNNSYLLIALYLFSFILIFDMLTVPLTFYGGFVLEHLFQLSNQRITGWIKDEMKKFFLSTVLLIFLGEVMYFFLKNFTEVWWIFTSMFWVLFTIVLAKLAPVVLFPLFYKIAPLDREDIKESLLPLLEGSGIAIEGVYQINLSKNTRKGNAALAGMGSTKRVILGDNLLDSYSLDEIKSIFAHELGHHVYNHVWKLLALGTLTGFSGFALCHIVLINTISIFGYQDIHDIAAFPLLCLVLGTFGFIALPVQNAFSRNWERACDLYAIQKTNNPQAFISTMNKLAEQNLADREPNRIIELLFYDHPPISKRIELAENFTNNVK